MFDIVRCCYLLTGQNDSRISLINKKESSSTPNVKKKKKKVKYIGGKSVLGEPLFKKTKREKHIILQVLWVPQFRDSFLSPSFISKRKKWIPAKNIVKGGCGDFNR